MSQLAGETAPDPRVGIVFIPDARIEGLHGFRFGDEVDIYALVSSQSVIFVDTASEPAQARQALETLALQMRSRQTLVIVTHADYDHAWGAAAFTDATGAPLYPIYGHRLTRDHLLSDEAREELDRRRAQSDGRFGDVRLIAPTEIYDDHLTIEAGDLTLELLHTPGHTPDHTVVWVPQMRLLLAGDAVESPFPYVHSGADLPTLRATLARLDDLRPEIIAPCHGGVFEPTLISRNLAYFDTLEAHCRAARAVGRRLAGGRDLTTMGEEQAGRALEAYADLTYGEALRLAGISPNSQVPEFYRAFHHAAIRATIEWLSATE